MALAKVNVSSGGGSKTPKLVSVPVQSGTLTYSGSAKTPTWSGYDSTQLTIGGTTSATNAGTYTATFTPKSGYTWTDGTSSPKDVTWTIGKDTSSLSTSISDSSLVYGDTATISITANTSGGAISATSSNPDAVVVQSVTSSTITIKCVGVSSESTTITITAAETSNYLSVTKTRSVSTAKAGGSIMLSATEGTVTYGTPLTFTVTQNTSGGTLSVKSANTTYATATISGNVVTVNCVAYASSRQTITVTSEETANYKKATAKFTVTCAKLFLAVPSITNTSFTYNGGSHAPTVGAYDSEHITVTNTAQTDAGSYDVVFALKNTTSCMWDDGTTKNKTTPWTIGKATLAVPLVTNTEFTYNGNSHAPTVGTYNSDFIDVTNTAQTNAGSYSITFTLNDTSNCKWSDNTTTAKNITWTIAKAERTLSFGLDKLVAPPQQAATVKIEGAGDSAMTATSSNTSVAAASLDESLNLVIELINVGTATITVTQAETDNYKAATKTLSVKCKYPSAITDSWATISTRSKNGTAANYYDIGDYKEITLNGNIGDYLTLENEKLRVFILHINLPMDGTPENNIIWGGFKNADNVDVVLCDSKYDTTLKDGTICFNMNHTGNVYDENGKCLYGTNYGGWKGCDLRYDILGATSTPPSEYNQLKSTSNVGYDATAATLTNPKANTLLAALPSDFRNALRLWRRRITSSTLDAVTLLAEFEIWGDRSWSSIADMSHQKQMEYYRLGGSKAKYNHTLTSPDVAWWFASPSTGGEKAFCCKSSSQTWRVSTYSLGLAPAFKT